MYCNTLANKVEDNIAKNAPNYILKTLQFIINQNYLSLFQKEKLW